MRRVFSAALAFLAVLGVSSAPAQQAEAAAQRSAPGILWSFDPVHGVMQAVPVGGYAAMGKAGSGAVVDASTPMKTYTGTIDITVTLNLVSTLPKNAALRCSATVDLGYQIEATSGSIPLLSSLLGSLNGESVDATVSAGVATCQFAIPYSWTIPASSSTTKVTINGIEGAVGIAADQLDAMGAVIRVYRNTTVQLIGPTAIPPDGNTTTLTASTVL
jgi:hypothetical protein